MSPLRWPRDPVLWVAFVFAVGATAFALFAGRYLPYVDWSNHLGLIAILARGAESGATAYFDRTWMPTPYLTFYACSALVGQLVPVDVAAKAVLSASAGLWVLGAAHLAESTGRSPRLAVFAPLGFFSVSLGWGFGSFVMTSPLLFFALGSMERLLALPRPRAATRAEARARRRRIVELGLVMALVYLGHALIFLCAALLVAVRGLSFVARAAWRRWVIDGRRTLAPLFDLILAAVPSILVALPALISYARHPWAEAGAAWALEFPPLGERVAGLAGHLLERGSPDHLRIMHLAAAVLVAAFIAAGLSRGAPRDAEGEGRSLGLELYAALLFAIYFFGPMTLGGVWFVYPRYAVLLGVTLFLLPRFWPGRRASLALLVVACGLIGANAALNRRHIQSFSSWARPFDRVRALIPPRSRVLPLTIVGPEDIASQAPALGSLYFYLLVDGARFVPFLFDNPGHPVRWRRDVQTPRAPFWRTPGAYDPRVHGLDYDYLVLRGRGLIERTLAAGTHELVENVDGWAVFRTKSPPPLP